MPRFTQLCNSIYSAVQLHLLSCVITFTQLRKFAYSTE